MLCHKEAQDVIAKYVNESKRKHPYKYPKFESI